MVLSSGTLYDFTFFGKFVSFGCSLVCFHFWHSILIKIIFLETASAKEDNLLLFGNYGSYLIELVFYLLVFSDW